MNLARPLLLAGLLAAAAQAQEKPMDAGRLAHALDRVANPARVLYVAAHPDDENTRLLACLANARHVTAAYLSMTRGGGGQNIIGAEQGVLLDVIRTEELLAARRLDGARQFFTRMKDFGYSKSAKEALRIWGHGEALADVVWVIRTFQPDVIVTRFDENPPNHGHHTASAILAREAFEAAADPKKFPDQLRDGVTPWKAKRLLHNLSTWRQVTIPPDALKLDVGGHDPRLGLGYGELAALSRSQHKSQGFGVAGERGPLIEHLVHVAGERAKSDLLDGVATEWPSPMKEALAEARRSLERDAPDKAVPALVKAYASFDSAKDGPRVREARDALKEIIAAAAGLFVRVTAPSPAGVPGSEVKVSVEVVPGLVEGVKVSRVWPRAGQATTVNAPLAKNEKKVVELAVPISKRAPVSSPYWLAKPTDRGHFEAERRLVGRPLDFPALEVGVELELAGRKFVYERPVVHAWTDRVHGERVRPFLVVPPVTVSASRNAVMFPNGRASPLVLRVKAGRDDVKGTLTPGLPKGWKASPASHAISLAKAGDEVTVRFEVTPPARAAAIEVSPEFDGAPTWREDLIDYPHIPVQLVLQPSRVKLVPLSLELPQGRVGYVAGSGDSVGEDLAHVGLPVDVLDDDALRVGDLSKYAAIIVGIRAYNVRPTLHAAHPRLMEYVERGGTVVVQFNTRSRWDPLDVPVGPYPLEIGRSRITDERARMSFVDPRHPALLRPNAIVDADFEGWVQERGVYFAEKWDERYQPLFSAADPDEEPLLGSTLVARHGKGRYVYTGLAFFRQLPAGVPGAYRLFANLLAAGP